MTLIAELARKSSALLGVLMLVLGLAVSGCSGSMASSSSSDEYHTCRTCSSCSSGHCPFATVSESTETAPVERVVNDSQQVHVAVPASYERNSP